MKTDWVNTMVKAEELVGSPTSFATLRSLAGDEVAILSTYANKLMQTQHPMLGTAKACFLGEGEGNRQIRGLIVLLMSKAANLQQSVEMATVKPKQRAMAEIVELVHTATLIHSEVVNMGTVSETISPYLNEQDLKDLDFGNKMAVLSGDMLLASACSALAQLHDVETVDMISRAIADISLQPFLTTDNDWEANAFLQNGSLLSKSCKASVKLGSSSDSVQLQQAADTCGKNFGYLLQMHIDMKCGTSRKGAFSHGQQYKDCIASSLSHIPSSSAKDVLLRLAEDLAVDIS